MKTKLSYSISSDNITINIIHDILINFDYLRKKANNFVFNNFENLYNYRGCKRFSETKHDKLITSQYFFSKTT